MFNSIEDIKAANEAAGQHWFAPDTMRFFNSRVLSGLIHGKGETFFISSEKREPSEHRMYTVRAAFDDGAVHTASEFMQFHTPEGARKAARKLAGEDQAKYRWIMYMQHPMGGFELDRAESINGAVNKLHSFAKNTWNELQDVTAVLYPYSAEDWAGAEEHEDDGNPFDYPSKLIEFGPRGGARITNA